MVEAVLSRIDDYRVSIDITVPTEEVEMVLEQTFRKLAANQKVKGFRKGKVPRDILLASVGKDNLYAETLNELVPRAYQDALKQVKVIPTDRPVFDSTPVIEEGKPLVLTAQVDVLPEINLPDYNNFVLDLDEKVEVKQEETDEAIESFRRKHAKKTPQESRPCAAGDEVELAYKLFVVGDDGAAQLVDEKDDVRIVLGENMLLPDIEQQVAGMSRDEEKTFDVIYPDNYQNHGLAGKRVKVDIHLLGILELEMPELTEEFLKKEGYESEEALRRDIEKNIRAYKERFREQEIRSAIGQKLLEEFDVKLPPKLVERDLQKNQYTFEMGLIDRGLTLEDYLKARGVSLEQWRQQQRAESDLRVKMGVLIGKIYSNEGLTVTDEELKQEIMKYAIVRRLSNHELRKMLKETDLQDLLLYNLKEKKAIDLLRARVRFKAADEPATAAIEEQSEGEK